jgi:DNA-binding transcriptional ArsR family regulator
MAALDNFSLGRHSPAMQKLEPGAFRSALCVHWRLCAHREPEDFRLGEAKLVTNLSLVSLPAAQSKGLISRKAAIGNCVTSLLTTHNRMVMVLGVKPANANHVFRALADPTRRAIFEELTRQGEQTVHALTRYAGVSQPAVSKHLTVLKRAKLVRHRREGRETHYRARPDALAPMVDWLNLYGAFWRDRFDQLENLLKRMDP